MRRMGAQELLQQAALKFAARGRKLTKEEASQWLDDHFDAYGDLSVGDVFKLPLMVWSLQDADRYGYRGGRGRGRF